MLKYILAGSAALGALLVGGAAWAMGRRRESATTWGGSWSWSGGGGSTKTTSSGIGSSSSRGGSSSSRSSSSSSSASSSSSSSSWLSSILPSGSSSSGGSGSGRVRIRDGVIYGPGGFRYRITDEDKLWLARLVLGEAGRRGGEEAAAVLWAMAQYHALVIGRGGRRPAFSTLTALLRSYSQPLSPRWISRDAEGCRRHPEMCSDRLLARRRRMQSIRWDEIPEAVRRVVERFVRGEVDNPVPGAVDWYPGDWSDRSSIPLINVGGNRFGVGRRRRLVS